MQERDRKWQIFTEKLLGTVSLMGLKIKSHFLRYWRRRSHNALHTSKRKGNEQTHITFWETKILFTEILSIFTLYIFLQIFFTFSLILSLKIFLPCQSDQGHNDINHGLTLCVRWVWPVWFGWRWFGSLLPLYIIPVFLLYPSLTHQQLRTHQPPTLRESNNHPLPPIHFLRFLLFIKRLIPFTGIWFASSLALSFFTASGGSGSTNNSSFKDMQPSSSSVKVSPLDLMSAIIKGKVDPSNMSDSGSEVASIIFENREMVMILTTSIAVLIGCVVILIWRRSSSSKPKTLELPKPMIFKEPEPEVDDGKMKVTIFFGTQTGTAEGFAKVRLHILIAHMFLYVKYVYLRF